MFDFFKNKKENWIVLMGGISLSLSILFYVFLGKDSDYEVSRSFSQAPLGLFIIISIVIAPVIEELAFRGFFSQKKSLQIFALVLTLILAIFSAKKTFIFLPLLVVIVASIFLMTKKNRIAFLLLVISNAVLFAVYHYTLNDFLSIHTFFYPLFHLSIGLFLIWIVLNFSLRRAVVVHGIWNAINIGIILVVIQSPSQKTHTYSNEKGTIEWEKVNRFFNDTSSVVNFNESGLKSTKTEPIKLFKILSKKDISELYLKVAQQEPYFVYDIEIRLYEKPISQQEVQKLCLSLLRESDLIKEFD